MSVEDTWENYQKPKEDNVGESAFEMYELMNCTQMVAKEKKKKPANTF